MPPLRMPHHATLCSSCLNCQSIFRLKVFLLFSTPTVVSLSSTLCSSVCVLAFVFQQSCSSSRVPAVVFQQSCSSIRVPASVSFVFQHLCFLCYSICVIRVPASVFFVFQQSCSSSRVSASVIVFQLLCSSISCACSITNRLPSMTTLTICVSLML